MTTIIILSTICVILLYITINQYFKISKYEELAVQSQASYENALNLLNKMIELFASAKVRLSKIDESGTFSSDDEVGFAFKLIDSTIVELHSKLLILKELVDGEGKEE